MTEHVARKNDEKILGSLGTLTLKIERISTELENNTRETRELKDLQKIANGRTSKLEVWQGVIKGGLGVVTALLVPVILMLINFYLRK